MKVCLVYDRVNKIGGAERVLLALHEMFPRAPLYTAVFHPQKASWAKDWDVRPSFLNRFPLAPGHHELYAWLTPIAFESFDFSDFDLVISITSAEAKAVITKPDTLHVCYCLTPTRYLWVHPEIYLRTIPGVLRPLVRPVLSYLKAWDRIAAARPDRMIAISRTVQERIKEHYKLDSEIIYPPVETDKFDKARDPGEAPQIKDYFLLVSRLVPYKRLDLAIRACNRLKLPLVVVGEGIKRRELSRLAGTKVKFVGELTDDKLVLYYQWCRALIFPQEEDFGISAVEAQAAGKPVIAFDRGGAREIIKEGKTGTFFSRQKTDSLVKALKEFESMQIEPDLCRKNAQRFSKDRFIKSFKSYIEEAWKKFTKEQ